MAAAEPKDLDTKDPMDRGNSQEKKTLFVLPERKDPLHLKNYPKLEELTIHKNNLELLITEDEEDDDVVWCPNLHKLTLHKCHGLAGIFTLVRRCPNISSVNFGAICPIACEGCIVAYLSMAEFTKLKLITCEGFWRIDALNNMLLSHAGEYLHFEGSNPKITQGFLKNILSRPYDQIVTEDISMDKFDISRLAEADNMKRAFQQVVVSSRMTGKWWYATSATSAWENFIRVN